MTEYLDVEGHELPSSNHILPDEDHSGISDEETSEQKTNREESRFKEGQILRFVRVRFPGNARSFPFLIGKRRIDYGQKVMALSDRGMAVGYVNSFPYDVPFHKSMLPVRSISKIASAEDIVKDKEAYHLQKNAENICNELIEQLKLDMQLTHVEFTSFGKKAVFYFIAPARVDFRDLVRDLVGKLKTRIELRQISVRDRSAAIGGIGPCGRELCCSSFLTKYGNVGVKMAKNQDLTLNFSKLNGVCGQLKCCLQYEDDVYREKRSRLPKEGDIIRTHNGDIGRVERLHLLSEQFVMITNHGVRRRYVVDLYKETLSKEESHFPKEFDSISDETHKVVGLDESLAKKTRAFEAEIQSLKGKSRSYAEETFAALFGEKTLGYSLPEVKELNSASNKITPPEEEEEIVYTPTEDEILPEDEMEEMVEDIPVRTRLNDREERSERGERPQREYRPRRDHQTQRDHQKREDNRSSSRQGHFRPHHRDRKNRPNPTK